MVLLRFSFEKAQRLLDVFLISWVLGGHTFVYIFVKFNDLWEYFDEKSHQ